MKSSLPFQYGSDWQHRVVGYSAEGDWMPEELPKIINKEF